jgi:hypothetical protein
MGHARHFLSLAPLAACSYGLFAVWGLLQPRHKEVALFQRIAGGGARSLAADDR